MHANRNGTAAGLARWTPLAWAAPLVLALFGCGGGGSAGGTPGGTANAQGAQLPAELTGQWETILTYVPPSYGGPVGGTTPGDGSVGITLVLTADGRYRNVWNAMQAYFNGNCFKTGGWDEFGTVTGAAPEFTFNPTKATFIQTDTCGQNKILDPAPVTPATHTLKLEHDNTGWPLLRVTTPAGDTVLEKCRHCG